MSFAFYGCGNPNAYKIHTGYEYPHCCVHFDNTAHLDLLHGLECHDIFLHLSLIFYSLIVSNDNEFDSNAKALVDDKRKKNIMAFGAMKQMKLCGVIEMYTTMSIFITSIHVSYGHWDYRSRRKQTRVPIMF